MGSEQVLCGLRHGFLNDIGLSAPTACLNHPVRSKSSQRMRQTALMRIKRLPPQVPVLSCSDGPANQIDLAELHMT
jgi:hypothetical protein